MHRDQGDDPDFVRTNTPAMAYSSMDACAGNCVDPTVGCTDDSCIRTSACNVSSTCAQCMDLDLPLSLRGVQIDSSYEGGIFKFEFAAGYTSAQITSPSGDVTDVTIENFQLDTSDGGHTYIGQFIIEDTPHYAMMTGLDTTGAIARNVYFAMSPNSEPIDWKQGIKYAHNGTYYALAACQYRDDDGNNNQAVSGLNKNIRCDL